MSGTLIDNRSDCCSDAPSPRMVRAVAGALAARFGLLVQAVAAQGGRDSGADAVGKVMRLEPRRRPRQAIPARRSLLVIHDAQARMKRRSTLEQTLQALDAKGAKAEVVVAYDIAESAVLASQAARDGRFEAVAVAGGDRSLRGAAAGLIGSGVPLGVIPVGRRNLIAEAYGISNRPEEIAETLLRGDARPVHPGLANGQPFLLRAGVCFDAELETNGSRSMLDTVARAAATWPLLRSFALRPPLLRVEADGETMDAGFVLVSRDLQASDSEGLGKVLPARRALESGPPPDGGLRLVMLPSSCFSGFFNRLRAAMAGQPSRLPGIVERRAGSVVLSTADPIAFHADGEWAGETPLQIGVSAQPLHLILPA